ncbi:MAG: hypothetical protein PHU63_04020 [Candidatus ainarchaeum sp.]|nr:hypothetical protein [Candidatus ainarchaeum sp.]
MSSPNPSEISEIIELNKKKAELLFKRNYLKWKNSENKELFSLIDSELCAVESRIQSIEEKSGKQKLILPDQKKLDVLNSLISSEKEDEVYTAMQLKQGRIYDLIKERGELLKNIIENKDEIAQLNLIVHSLEKKEQETILNLISDRLSFSDKSLSKLKDKNKLKKLNKILFRLGFPLSKENCPEQEKRISIGSKCLWVPVSMVEKISSLNNNLSEFSKKIQLANAKKQIQQFSNSEEEEFTQLQEKYLSLLKEQDNLIDSFSD